MKFGHVTGMKKERIGVTPEFDRIQAAHLARLEREYAAQATATLPEPSTTVVPVALAEGDYKDWEVTVDGERYLVIDEAGDWELRQLATCSGWGNDWQLIGVGTAVDEFLTAHNLTLGA